MCWVRQTRRIARDALLAHHFSVPPEPWLSRSSFFGPIQLAGTDPVSPSTTARFSRTSGLASRIHTNGWVPPEKDEHVAASFRQTALLASLCHFAMWYLRCGLKQRSPRLKLHCERTSSSSQSRGISQRYFHWLKNMFQCSIFITTGNICMFPGAKKQMKGYGAWNLWLTASETHPTP